MNPLEAHRPRTLEEFGPSLAIASVKQFVESLAQGARIKPILLLVGPAGCGKTTLIRCVAHDFGLDLADCNASDDRSADSIRAAANAAMNGTAVFLDEAEQISGKEQRLLVKLAPSFKAPVFMATNDDSRLERDLKDLCFIIQIPVPSKQRLRDVGKKVGASPRAILNARSFRDLIHDSDSSTTGEFAEGDVLASLLGGDEEAGKTTDLMRAEPWILDNTEGEEAASYDLWRSRYREVGSVMEKYLRRAAAGARIGSLRFPWSLAARGRAKREREAEKAPPPRKAEKEPDLEALKKAQELASRPKVAAMDEWV